MTSHHWVLADPFRAHVRHLCESTGLPWLVVAAAAGVSSRSITTLMRGRDGRLRARLCHADAERLFRITVGTLREGAVRVESPGEARALVRALLAHGVGIEQLTTLAGALPGELENLRDGRAFGVRRLVLWRLRAVAGTRAVEPLDAAVETMAGPRIAA